MNKLLIKAARQYQHNDCSGLVMAYDEKETEKVVNSQSLRIEKLEFALNYCINFGGGKLTDCKMKQASEILKAS